MGSNDISPPHVPAFLVPFCAFTLQVGGGLWTIAYVLYARESFRSKSYGMPMFALALNFGWEIVYALAITEAPLEKLVFTLWLLLDCGMVYGMIRHARYEWSHAPLVEKNVLSIFSTMAVVAIAGHWTFAKWWVDNDVGRKEGKFYRGRIGPDTTELGFWSALMCQAYLSAASLSQLIVRQHTGGVSWTIWLLRTLGSIIGLYLPYALQWYLWREAHEYVANPFALFMSAVGIASDLIYPLVHRHAQQTERVLPDGRKIAGHVREPASAKTK